MDFRMPPEGPLAVRLVDGDTHYVTVSRAWINTEGVYLQLDCADGRRIPWHAVVWYEHVNEAA